MNNTHAQVTVITSDLETAEKEINAVLKKGRNCKVISSHLHKITPKSEGGDTKSLAKIESIEEEQKKLKSSINQKTDEKEGTKALTASALKKAKASYAALSSESDSLQAAIDNPVLGEPVTHLVTVIATCNP